MGSVAYADVNRFVQLLTQRRLQFMNVNTFFYFFNLQRNKVHSKRVKIIPNSSLRSGLQTADGKNVMGEK